METIVTVKENGQGGFLVNGTMNVPNADGNRHYAMVQEWIANGGIVEPFETQAEIAQREKDEANAVEYALLGDIDKASIRDIRAYIASLPDAPQSLKNRELQAVESRARIIK